MKKQHNMSTGKRKMTMFNIIVIRPILNFVLNLLYGQKQSQLSDTINKIDVLKEKLTRLKTPSGINKFYIDNSISYIADGVDYTKSSHQFVNDNGGDCDDYAEFAYSVLKDTGYDCFKLYLFGENIGHVVTVAERKDNGKVFIMDNHILVSRFTSVDDACESMLNQGYDGYFLR